MKEQNETLAVVELSNREVCRLETLYDDNSKTIGEVHDLV